jgi:hypothetical protein
VDFKLENVLVFLHSLKTMGLCSIIFRGMESFSDILLYVNMSEIPFKKMNAFLVYLKYKENTNSPFLINNGEF